MRASLRKGKIKPGCTLAQPIPARLRTAGRLKDVMLAKLAGRIIQV